MENSKQLFEERKRLAEAQNKLMDEGKETDALIVQGQIQQIDTTLEHVLDEEDRLRNEARMNKPADAARFGERVLGPRDEFKGLEVGMRNEATVVSVPAPTEIELQLPGKSASLLNNFAATLPSAPAIGSVSYKQRSAQIGGPDTWAGIVDGSSATKAKVIYTWKDAVANKETIAGYVPVSKDTLKDYDELMTIIESDLLIDLNEKTNSKYMTGNSNSGIIGVLNTVGILEFASAVGGLYYEAIRRMRTQVMKNARRVPTTICMNPDIKEAIDLYKTETGLYQFLGDGVLWGMNVVEDFDCDGILVYDAFAARKRPIHGLTVEPGYVNDQFIKNELCLLAEQTTALQVVYPDAFCHASKASLDAKPTA